MQSPVMKELSPSLPMASPDGLMKSKEYKAHGTEVVNDSNDKSRDMSSKSKDTSGFDSLIKPVSLDDTGTIVKPKKVEEPVKKEEEGSGLVSDNYDDDDFDDIGESLPPEALGGKESSGEDFFNKNKNFTGGLASLGGKQDADKESDPSGLGFDDHDQYNF